MLQLHTLGRAFVADERGSPLAGAASQRRTLALLAALAVAGDAGLSRDKLIGLLWPEAEEERARHSLTQALYAARRALGCEDLFVLAPSTIRLNADRIVCDVRVFESAIESGNLAAAVASYGGPFLDGFFLSSAPEFEQWSSAQRERLESKMIQSLEALAADAERDGEYERAVDWRRQLATLRPLDSGTVARFMAALASAGDRAGAIQQARLHATRLQEEMELEPDPVVEALAAQLRSGASWRPDVATPELDEEVIVSMDEEHGAAIVETPDRTEIERVDTPLSARALVRPLPEVTIPFWVRWTVLSLVVLSLIGAGVLLGRARGRSDQAVEPLPVRQRVLVAPFRVAGADPSLAYLRDGVVELLSTRLADDTSARSVDAGAVLGAWRAAGLSPAMDVSRDTVVQLARRLGAERVVIGSVVGTPSRLILRAVVLVVPSGVVSAEASISGSTDDLTALIDRLAGHLLAVEAGEDERLALQTTRSLPALRAFLAGQASLRALDYTAAQREYESALRRDSAFALAALQAATVADRLLDLGSVRRNLAAAWAHRDALTARDRMLLDAFTGPRFPNAASVEQQWAAWQRIIDVAPADADLWFSLGSRILHDGALAALPSARARAIEALQQASASQPHAPARALLVAMGAAAIDTNVPSAALGPFAPFARWRAAAARADSATLAHLRDTLYLLGRANLRAIAQSSLYDGAAVSDGAYAIEQLAARPARTVERVDLLLAEHAFALVSGQLREALDVTARLERAQPGAHVGRRLRVLDWLYGDGDSTAAASAARELAALAGTGPSAALATSESWYADQCVLGQWHAARGDSGVVRRIAGVLHAQRAMTTSGVVSASPGACAELLEATHAVLVRDRNATTRVRALDSLVMAPHVVGDLATYAPLALARLHERLDDGRGALSAIRRRAYMADWPRYVAVMLREEARLAERLGDVSGMRNAYTQYLSYRDPDPESSPELSAVRRRLGVPSDSTRR